MDVERPRGYTAPHPLAHFSSRLWSVPFAVWVGLGVIGCGLCGGVALRALWSVGCVDVSVECFLQPGGVLTHNDDMRIHRRFKVQRRAHGGASEHDGARSLASDGPRRFSLRRMSGQSVVLVLVGVLVVGTFYGLGEAREERSARQVERSSQLEERSSQQAERRANLRLVRELAFDPEGAPRLFSGLDLTGASLGGFDLSGADFSGAVLQGANLSGADLTGANLQDANLTGADLSGANLTGANLNGADVTGANLNGAVLSAT